MRLRANRLCLLAVLAPAWACGGGCGLPDLFVRVLGYHGEYILVACDVLALPGQEVRIETRLREAEVGWRPAPTGIYVFRDGSLYSVARTDANGAVHTAFRPPGPGDYRFRVECYAPEKRGDWPLQADVLVACREANAPLLVVDIDQTLTETRRRRDMLFGDPNAADRSVEVLSRLGRRHAVVYLTHRWDYLSKRTREWLDRHGYPAGPILAARGREMIQDNERYKSHALAELRKRFPGAGWGIGDKASDARAYAGAGLSPILLLPTEEMRKPQHVRQAIREALAAPPAAQVATDWDQIERAVLESAPFPAEAAVRRLQALLEEMERRK